MGHTTEILFLITALADLVRKNPCPRPAKGGSGRPPVHSDDKMDFICLFMVALNLTYRGVEKWLPVLKIPWNEPVPDHTTIARHLHSNRIKDSENSAMRHTNRKTLIEPLPRDHMRPAKAVKLGEEFLKGISEGELVSMQAMEKDYKVKTMLQAARHRKRGMLLKEISEAIGEAVSTVHGWLMRLEEDMGRRYDRKSPGRPCRLSDAQREALGGDLDKSPEKSDFFSSVWTARLVARRIRNRFEIKYGDRGVLKLTARMNFSVRTTRPVPYNSATKEELEKYVGRTVEAVKRHDEERFKILFLDIAGAVDSPASKRGIRRRGSRDTVPINHSKKSVKIVGALGMGTLDIQFHEKANSESVIALLEYLRRRYGRIFVILDNAAAHTGTAMREYIGERGAMWFCGSCPRAPRSTIPSRWSGERSRGRYRKHSSAGSTNCRRESGCCVAGRFP